LLGLSAVDQDAICKSVKRSRRPISSRTLVTVALIFRPSVRWPNRNRNLPRSARESLERFLAHERAEPNADDPSKIEVHARLSATQEPDDQATRVPVASEELGQVDEVDFFERAFHDLNNNE
jgi:hypothetical protein